jgi:hypothetical protein
VKPCKVCRCPATGTINQGLQAGISPRSLGKMFKELSRTDVTKHRDKCLPPVEEETTEEGAA